MCKFPALMIWGNGSSTVGWMKEEDVERGSSTVEWIKKEDMEGCGVASSDG